MLRLRSLLVALSLLICGILLAQQATQEESIRVTTGLVVIDARVVNEKTGLPVNGLRADDFEIYEDGVRQEITHFSRDLLPLSIVLLLDVSGSMQRVIEELYTDALRTLVSLKAEDEVALVVYGSLAQLLQDFTKDRRLVVERIRTANESYLGPRNTSLSEAVFQASAYLAHAHNPISRRIVIGITDDTALESRLGYTKAEALDQLMESAASLYGLAVINWSSKHFLGRPPRTTVSQSTSVRLQYFADPTGGVVLPADLGAVGARLTDLLDGIRASYTLGYVPANRQMNGEFRKVQVRLKSRHVFNEPTGKEIKPLVIARNGYFAGARPSAKSETSTPDAKSKRPAGGIFDKPEQREIFQAMFLKKDTRAFHASILPAIFLGPHGETLARLCFLFQPDRIRLKEFNGKYNGQFELLAEIFNETGMIVTFSSQDFHVSFDEIRYQEFLRLGGGAGMTAALAPGKYEVMLALRDMSLQGSARLEPLEVFSLSKELPCISSIVLTRSMTPPTQGGARGDDYDPLRLGDQTVLPSLTEAYPPEGSLTVFFHVYNVSEQYQYRLKLYRDGVLCRTSDPKSVRSEFRHPMNGYLLAPTLSLSDLTPGTYTVDVEVAPPGGKPVSRSASFRVK